MPASTSSTTASASASAAQQPLRVGAQHRVLGGERRERMPRPTASTSCPSRRSPPARSARAVDGDDEPHVPAPAVGTTESADSSAIAASVGRDIRSRDDEFERGRAAADHRVVARDRDDGGVGDEDARRVVFAVLEQRRGPDLDDAAGVDRRGDVDRCCGRRRSWCATRAASPTAPRARARPPTIVRVATRPSVERVGGEVRLADLPERDIDDRRDRPASTVSPGTIVCAAANTGAVCRAARDDEPHAGDGGDDEQDAEEEADVAPGRRGAGRGRASTAVMAPIVAQRAPRRVAVIHSPVARPALLRRGAAIMGACPRPRPPTCACWPRAGRRDARRLGRRGDGARAEGRLRGVRVGSPARWRVDQASVADYLDDQAEEARRMALWRQSSTASFPELWGTGVVRNPD